MANNKQHDIFSERFVSGYGQFHTNEPDPKKPDKKLRPYTPITLGEIRDLVNDPQQVDKADARWLIPSTLMSRTFRQQETDGAFWMLWADLDSDPKPLGEVEGTLLWEILNESDFELYTSRSATTSCPKARIIVPLAKPLSGRDWKICQEIFNDKLDAAGITPDRASERAAQLCYLPNRGQLYENRSNYPGVLFDPLSTWAEEFSKIVLKRTATEEALTERRREAMERRAKLKPGGSADLIGTFNATYTVDEILLKAGYEQCGDTFRHPQSQSGSFSASVQVDEKGAPRVHSLSSNDPLYTGGGGGGAHDAFSAFAVLYAGGDQNSALKLAGDKWLMINGETWNIVRQREYREKQNSRQDFSTEDARMAADIESLFADVTLREEDVQKMTNAEFLIPDMIVRGHIAAYVAPGNGGKTTVFIFLCEQLARMGLKVLYINVDGSPGDLKRHYAHAKAHGYTVIAPDARDGKSTVDVLEKLRLIAAGETRCDEYVFILDTLKKFVDVIDKRQAKEIYKLFRTLSVKGATICLLGHCNKYKDEDGKAIFEGTADLRNDLDELIYLDSFKNENSNTLEITTRPDKVRAEFSPKSYMIHLDDRSVTEADKVIKILSKEQRELLDLVRESIDQGNHSQKEIIGYVKPKTAQSDKKIRNALIEHSHGPHAEFDVSATGRAKDLHYTIHNPSGEAVDEVVSEPL